MPKLCEICGGELDQGVCVRCYGAVCRMCGEPLYRDESVKRDCRGVRHVRCFRSAVARPAVMPDVSMIGVAVG